MEFVFINKLISNEDNKLTHAQLVHNYRFSLDIESKVVPLKALEGVYENSLNNEEFICDFSIDDSMLTCDTKLPIVKIDSNVITEIEGKVQSMGPIVNNIYELFTNLVDDCCYYLDNRGREHISEETVVNYITKFIPKFSAKTMTVYVPFKVNDEWKSNKIIYAENGMLKTKNFICLVPEDLMHKYNKYNLDKVGECRIKSKSYVALEYTGQIPIYAYIGGEFKLYPSIANRYVFMSEIYGMYINNAKYLKEFINPKKEEEIIEPPKTKPSVSRYTDSYVYFEPNFKRLTKNQRIDYINDIMQTVVPGLQSGWGNEGMLKHMKELNLTEIERMNYIYIFEILLENLGDVVGLINKCDSEIEYYSKLKFKTDNFIYAMRSCMFVFNTGYNATTILRGSDVPSCSFIRQQRKEK